MSQKMKASKRLLSLLLMLVMVLGMLPTTAFATSNRVSTITGTVTGLTAPVCGAKVGTIAPKFTFTEESHATANIGSTSCWEKYDDYYGRWYKWWESQPSGGLFTPGKWRFKQEIYMNEGYVRDTSSFSVVINGETWKSTNFDSEPTFCIAYSPEYTVSAGTATLTEARSGVAVTPVFDGYLNELNAQGKLSFQWMRKASGGSGFIQIPGATGSSYTPTDSDVGATIYVAVWETERKVVTSSVVSNQVVVKASVGHTLNSVQASVTVPTVGASKEDCVPRLTTANMTIDHYNWYYTGSGDQTNLRSENFTTFEDDGNYLCLIYVKPNSTYAFAVDATGMVNGETAEIQNGTDLVRLSYAVKVAKPPILTGNVSLSNAYYHTILNPDLSSNLQTMLSADKLSFQWQRSTDGINSWTNISGAADASYKPNEEDVGKYIRVVITADGYEGSVISNAVEVKQALINFAKPVAPEVRYYTTGGVVVENAKAGQEYIVKYTSDTPADWSGAVKATEDGNLALGDTYGSNTTVYVHTRVAATAYMPAGMYTEYGSVYIGSPSTMVDIALNHTKLDIKVRDVVKLTVKPVPDNDTSTSAFWFVNGTEAKLYIDEACTTEYVRDTHRLQPYVYLKGIAQTNSITVGAEKTISSMLTTRQITVAVTDDAGNYLLDGLVLPEVTLTPGESTTVDITTMPVPAPVGTLSFEKTEGTSDLTLTAGADNKTLTIKVPENATAGSYYYSIKVDGAATKIPSGIRINVVSEKEIPVESVTVVPSTTTMAPGTSITPTAIINPSNHTETGSVVWSKVSGSGSITIAPGTGMVTASDSAVDGDTATVRATFGDKHGECSITVSTIKYGVTVTDGTATVSGTGISKAAEGTTITLTANTAPICQVFDKWVVEDESASITLADATSANTTFIMPASSVSVKATYKDAPGLTSITNANVTVTAPVKGGTPANATTADTQYTVTSTLWLPVDDPFEPSTVYNVMVALKVNEGNQFTSDTAFKINGENATVLTQSAGYAQISYIFPATASSGSSSGGSSGGGVSTHAITVDSAKNGDVTSSHKSAAKGTTITLTVEPDKGYTLETITATDASGNKLKLTEKDGKYTFTMPASKVTVKATFMEDNSMLNFFVDVPADAYYYDAVLWAAEKGITGGVDAAHFAPNATCTRAQAVTFLWRAAGSPTPKSSEMPFTDVAPGSYYETAVLWAVENGITKGTSDTTFTPNAKFTRAQIVTFLWRSEKSPAAGSRNPFADVKSTAYYADAVLWAVKEDITKGSTNTTFSPDADCTRAQIVTFLWRCKK